MRTTIELPNDLRAGLLTLAGKRGLRGYSLLVQEALAQYLSRPMPAPLARQPPERRKKGSDPLLAFCLDGFSTSRADGSESHDDYIYRGR